FSTMFGRTEESKFMTDAVRRFVRDVSWVVLCVEFNTGVSQPGEIRRAGVFQPLASVTEPTLRPRPYFCKASEPEGHDKDLINLRRITTTSLGTCAYVVARGFYAIGVEPDKHHDTVRNFAGEF